MNSTKRNKIGLTIKDSGKSVEADAQQLNIEDQEENIEDEYPQLKKRTRTPQRFTFQSGATPLTGYTIKRGIGVGGFGEVYFAISDAGKEVALKRIQRNLDIELRGVNQCLNLKHTNLIALWDIRQDEDGESWVVMEYVPGDSLRDMLEKNPDGVPLADARKWFAQILAGVRYLHDHGIVHRDLKPGNIFYDQDEGIVKIGDYGLSKFISASKRDGQTESVGTFHYMAPEIGKGSYGKEIDIYSLGVILCEILSGRVPFDGESGQEIMMKHLTATPELDFLPSQFRSIARKTLEKDPAHRYRTVEQLEADLNWEDSAPLEINADGSLVDRQSTRRESKSKLAETMFIRDDEPMYIGDEEIQIGEAVDRTNEGLSSTIGPVREEGKFVGDPQNVRGVSPRSAVTSEVVPADMARSTFNQSVQHSSPSTIGLSDAKTWWNGNSGAAFWMVGSVVLLFIILINNASLVPLAMILCCLYLVYCFVSSIFFKEKTPVANTDATVMQPFSRAECLKLVEEKLRAQRRSVPVVEKFVELLGSIMMSALVVAVSLLMVISLSGFELQGTAASWAVLGWTGISAFLGAGCIIASTKFFESAEGNQWTYRFILMSLGMVVGWASFGLHQYFLIDQVVLPDLIAQLDWIRPGLLSGGSTELMVFLTFFGGFYGMLRWWRVGDPLRGSQFSILQFVLHLLLAISFAWLIKFPVIWALMVGGGISLAVQTSATWVPFQEREKIQADLIQVNSG